MTDPAASLASSQQPQGRHSERPAPVAFRLRRRFRPEAFSRRSALLAKAGLPLEYVTALGITAGCTAIAYPWYASFGPVNTAMLYLLGTTLGALRLRRGPCLLLPFANILAFDFFFVPPTFSFDIDDVRYIFTLAVMLIVAGVIAQLMISIRRHRDVTLARERRTAVLYAMSRELLVATDQSAMTAAAVRHISAVFQGSTAVLLADDAGCLQSREVEDGGASDFPSPAERLIAGDVIRREARQLIDGTAYLPLPGRPGVKGVVIVRPHTPARTFGADQLNLLDAFAAQLAMSLQRARTAEDAEVARIAAERAALRNTLLASISHDLRTPLAAIAGAGSLIAEPGSALNADRRTMLGRLIERKAGDMTQLLSNVLDLAKMELGHESPRTDWHSIDDLVSHSLRLNEARLSGRRIAIDVPENLPSILVEATLIVQILSNLLENAAKYTPPGTTITICAQAAAGTVSLVVADDGPGLPGDPERLFDKFQRGVTESTVTGVGLGLTICRAAARLHGGDIKASNQAAGGARFEITLPVQTQWEPALA